MLVTETLKLEEFVRKENFFFVYSDDLLIAIVEKTDTGWRGQAGDRVFESLLRAVIDDSVQMTLATADRIDSGK